MYIESPTTSISIALTLTSSWYAKILIGINDPVTESCRSVYSIFLCIAHIISPETAIAPNLLIAVRSFELAEFIFVELGATILYVDSVPSDIPIGEDPFTTSSKS